MLKCFLCSISKENIYYLFISRNVVEIKGETFYGDDGDDEIL